MAVRILLALKFSDWASDNGVTDLVLLKTASEIESGLVDARLGGFLLKKRIAAPGRGKSGSYRVILAYRQADRLVFLYGFAKNEQENITKADKIVLHQLAALYMNPDDRAINDMIQKSLVWEIGTNEPNS